jgi:hypothetical protein
VSSQYEREAGGGGGASASAAAAHGPSGNGSSGPRSPTAAMVGLRARRGRSGGIRVRFVRRGGGRRVRFVRGKEGRVRFVRGKLTLQRAVRSLPCSKVLPCEAARDPAKPRERRRRMRVTLREGRKGAPYFDLWRHKWSNPAPPRSTPAPAPRRAPPRQRPQRRPRARFDQYGQTAPPRPRRRRRSVRRNELKPRSFARSCGTLGTRPKPRHRAIQGPVWPPGALRAARGGGEWLKRREARAGRGVSDQYGVRDAACPLSTRGGGRGGASAAACGAAHSRCRTPHAGPRGALGAQRGARGAQEGRKRGARGAQEGRKRGEGARTLSKRNDGPPSPRGAPAASNAASSAAIAASAPPAGSRRVQLVRKEGRDVST